MAYDFQPWIQARKQSLLGKLAATKSSRARVVGEPERDALDKRLSNAIVFIGLPLALFVAFKVFTLPAKPENFVLDITCILLALVLGCICLGIMSEGISTKHLSRKIWAVPLSPDDARQLGEWIKAYPPIRDICVQWGGSRSDPTLHSIDFARIAEVCQKLVELDTQLATHINSQIEAANILNRHVPGLAEEMQSASQANTLQHTTTTAEAPAKPRRI